MVEIQMRKNRILLRQSIEELTPGGIQTSMDGKERDLREVLAVGEGVEDVKEGDTVLVNHFTVKEVEFGGETYGLCLEDAVYAIIGQGTKISEEKETPKAKESPIITNPSGLIY